MITLFVLNICFKVFCYMMYYSIMLVSNILFVVLDFCYGFITGFVTGFITEYRKAKQEQSRLIQGPPDLLILDDGTLNPSAVKWLKEN